MKMCGENRIYPAPENTPVEIRSSAEYILLHTFVRVYGQNVFTCFWCVDWYVGEQMGLEKKVLWTYTNGWINGNNR